MLTPDVKKFFDEMSDQYRRIIDEALNSPPVEPLKAGTYTARLKTMTNSAGVVVSPGFKETARHAYRMALLMEEVNGKGIAWGHVCVRAPDCSDPDEFARKDNWCKFKAFEKLGALAGDLNILSPKDLAKYYDWQNPAAHKFTQTVEITVIDHTNPNTGKNEPEVDAIRPLKKVS